MGWFSPTIQYEIKQLNGRELHGDEAVDFETDRKSYGDMKKLIKSMFKDYECRNCGGHKVEGTGVILEVRPMKFFKEIQKKKLFGGYSYVEKHYKTMYRITDIYFNQRTMMSPLSSNGYIKCKSCGWESDEFANANTYSLNDMLGTNY